MEIYELADLAISTQMRLDTSWAVFLTINSSFIAGVIFLDRHFTRPERGAVILIYGLLTLLSYMKVANSFAYLAVLYSDISKFEISPEQPGHDAVQHFILLKNSFFMGHPSLVPVIYILMFLVVSLAIYFDDQISAQFKKE